jgi:hypothetical protein
MRVRQSVWEGIRGRTSVGVFRLRCQQTRRSKYLREAAGWRVRSFLWQWAAWSQLRLITLQTTLNQEWRTRHGRATPS